MSNPGAPNPFAALVITGNSAIDTIIRYFLMAAMMALTGIIVGWLNAHGFKDPNMALMVSGALVSLLGAGVVAAWGILRSMNMGKIIMSEKVKSANATLCLVASGEALDDNNKVVPLASNTTPPKPITIATMPEIDAKFGK